jgi:hypothetical protein
VADERAIDGAGDGLHRDIVVGRADAAGGEDQRGAREQAEEGVADGGEVVLDGAHLDQADPAAAQHERQVVAVLVADLAAQQLVADEQHGRGG